MFSFFKRSKSQKGKQKHEKPLQLVPAEEPEVAPAAVCSEEPSPPPPPCAKVASDAYASAAARQTGRNAPDGTTLGSRAGDEEKQAKNSSPPGGPVGQADGGGLLAPLGERCERSPEQLLPSKCRPTAVPKGATDDGDERNHRAIDVSSSDLTRQHGSVAPEYECGSGREASANGGPIDDSAGCAREPRTPHASHSSSSYAPQSESAMAKGKNRRRYQQQQNQQNQQQPNQQHVKPPQQQQQQQQQNVLKLSLPKADSSGGQDGSTQGRTHLSNLAKAMSGTVPIKVIEEFVEMQQGKGTADAEPNLPPGDVTKAEQDGSTTPRTIERALAKTHTSGDASGAALVSPNACAPLALAVTHTTTTPQSGGDSSTDGQLLNINHISPTAPALGHHAHQGGNAVQSAHDTTTPAADRALSPAEATILPPAVGSSAPGANLTVSEANATGSEAANSSARAAEQRAPTSIQEMGQQPSRAGSEQRATAPSQRTAKSTTPPLPPPRSQRPAAAAAALPAHELEAATRHTVVIVQDAAAGDDTSDDRDVFYEAKETLSPTSGTDAADDDRHRRVAGSEHGAEPEPIRASLVLKLADVPDHQRQPSPQKKQVSFKLTQNGSDDVEVSSTSVDSSDVDSDSEVGQATGQDGTLPSHTAFSERANNGVFSREDAGKNYIEFQYDHSASSPAEGVEKCGEEKCAKADGAEQRNKSELIEDSVASLPDVVQPSNIEPPASFGTVEKINSDMKDLVNQEQRYSAKLEEAEKRVKEANVKVYELQQKLDAVERDALLKEYNVERLQAELVAALKECEGIRARLTTQQSEMETIRLKASDREDELNLKYQNLEIEHLELTEKLAEVRQLAHELNSQLIDAKSEVDRLKEERQKLLDERTEEQKIMREALEESVRERAQVEAKWKQSFEQLRDVNNAREEDLMKDCEFTIRSMQKTCKEKMETVEKERKQALEQVSRLEELARKRTDEVRHLKSYEAEVEQLRGLTYDQKESLLGMTRQVESLKAELETAYNKLEEEMVKVQQIKNRCEYQLCEKEREALNRIEIARGEIAMQWEDRLLHEMNRLKVELEQTHMEERTSAIEKLRREALAETEAMSRRFNEREMQLKNEIDSLKAKLEQQKTLMANAQTDADQKLLQSRMYVERAEREHERKLAKEMSEKDEIIETLKQQFEKEKLELEQHFSERIQQVQEEFAREISDTTELMKTAHKKELETQWKALVAEKEEALHLMDSRNRHRLEDAENKIRELTTSHQRQLKDLQEEHSFVVHSLESRDTKNAQEIQTLHKKCRCLTNLFEEMRLRYERREPRMEDLQQIEELKTVIESQERDLRQLTERLRELQLQQQQQDQHPPQTPRRSKPNRGRQQKQQQSNQQQQQGNRQQQQQGNKQQQKKGRQQAPAEPEQCEEAPYEEEDHQQVDEIEYVESLGDAPQVVLIPPAQFIPPMVHRTPCDVIYEENEEEEEAAQVAEEEEDQQQQQQQQQETEELEPEVEQSNENNEVLVIEVEEPEESVTVVDVPASAIQTEDRVIHSTTPTIIEDVDDAPQPNSSMPLSTEERSSSEPPKSINVVRIENVTESTNQRPRASSAPRIIITDATEKSAGESTDLESTTVVEIVEQPSPEPVEQPPVFAKPYPAVPTELSPSPTECVGDSAQTVASAPEQIVVPHLPEGVATPDGQ
ncbi:envoplakin-like isoform X1 [Anopheles merus]|uniref:envoplakin-like isoform X1 n=1 Tax=Anopheles merus TaxID=30066 RepID=UPI001BE3D20F|nr:envoplakin-like isoform X1 [Anopheles merus]